MYIMRCLRALLHPLANDVLFSQTSVLREEQRACESSDTDQSLFAVETCPETPLILLIQIDTLARDFGEVIVQFTFSG